MRILMLLAVLLICGPAQAASLRSMTTLHGPTVYLRDLFDDAGVERRPCAGSWPRSRRPDRRRGGATERHRPAIQRGMAVRLARRSRGAGVARPSAAARRRPSRRCVSPSRPPARPKISTSTCPDSTPPIVPVEATPVATVSQLEYDSNTGRFTAALTVTGEGMNPIDTRISGRVDEIVEAPVAVTRLLPETVLRPDDVQMARVRAAMLHNEVARSVDQVIGMQLRRPVAAGQPLRLADLSRPPLVQRGATRADRAVLGRPVGHRPGGGVGRRCRGR